MFSKKTEFYSSSVQDTEKFGFELAEKLDTGGAKRAFIAMRGEMGVGKTAFTRGFASYFGITGVKSPTYSIVNEYRSPRASIFHFDMYRIETDDDLYSIGFDDYVEKDGYAIAEWSENIEDFLPENTLFVTISRTPDVADGRIITVENTFPKD